MHSSGETIEGVYPVICKDWNNPQAVGSGMSYGRRYALSSMVSLPQIDDDAAQKQFLCRRQEKPLSTFHCTLIESDRYRHPNAWYPPYLLSLFENP